MPRKWQSMLRLQANFGKKVVFVFPAQHSTDFLQKARAKGQPAVAISLAQVDARAEALALGRRPNRLIPPSTVLYSTVCF